MSKFKVDLTRTQTYVATVEVDADDEDMASSAAKDLAEGNVPGNVNPVAWTEEEDFVEVDDVTEIEGDDEDDDAA